MWVLGLLPRSELRFPKLGPTLKYLSTLKEYDNGESDIVVHGIRRIIILEYHEHPDGYFEARVEGYNDLNEVSVNEYAVEELKNKFKEIIEKVNFKIEDSFWINYIKNPIKTFKIAEKSGLTLTQQQTLLTIQDENKRIEYLWNHFNNLEKQIEKSVTLKGIILGDGYINN